jgi:hypothetical protein
MGRKCAFCLVNDVAAGSKDKACTSCKLATDRLTMELEPKTLPTPMKNAAAIAYNRSFIRENAESIADMRYRMEQLQLRVAELTDMLRENHGPRHKRRGVSIRVASVLYRPQHLSRA